MELELGSQFATQQQFSVPFLGCIHLCKIMAQNSNCRASIFTICGSSNSKTFHISRARAVPETDTNHPSNYIQLPGIHARWNWECNGNLMKRQRNANLQGTERPCLVPSPSSSSSSSSTTTINGGFDYFAIGRATDRHGVSCTSSG